MELKAIVAADLNNVIGINGKLPWHISEDLQNFKKLTMGKPIIMGRKTYESIGKALPGRLNIVISSGYKQGVYGQQHNLLFANSLEAVMDWLEIVGTPEAFIVGGESVYKEAEPHLTTVYLTRVLQTTQVWEDDVVSHWPIKIPSHEWRLTAVKQMGGSFTIQEFQRCGV